VQLKADLRKEQSVRCRLAGWLLLAAWLVAGSLLRCGLWGVVSGCLAAGSPGWAWFLAGRPAGCLVA